MTFTGEAEGVRALADRIAVTAIALTVSRSISTVRSRQRAHLDDSTVDPRTRCGIEQTARCCGPGGQRARARARFALYTAWRELPDR